MPSHFNVIVPLKPLSPKPCTFEIVISDQVDTPPLSLSTSLYLKGVGPQVSQRMADIEGHCLESQVFLGCSVTEKRLLPDTFNPKTRQAEAPKMLLTWRRRDPSYAPNPEHPQLRWNTTQPGVRCFPAKPRAALPTTPRPQLCRRAALRKAENSCLQRPQGRAQTRCCKDVGPPLGTF